MADIKDLQALVDDLYREINKLKAEKKQLDENSIEAGEKELAILEEQVKVRRAELEIARKKEEGVEDAVKHLEETLELHKQHLELLEKQREVYEEVNDLSRSFASEINGLLGIMEEVNDSGFGKMLSLIKKSGQGISGVTNAINNAAIKLSENLKTRIMLSLAEKGQEMLVGFFQTLDEAGANLAKTIPEGRKLYQGMVEDIVTGNQAAYFSFEQVSESVIDLNTNFTEFSRLSDPEKSKLIKLSSTLDRIGVSTDTLAENLDVATKALGLSTSEFEDFQGQLFTLSKQLGVNMDTLNKRFKDVSSRLSQFEKTKAIKIFKEMNVVAKNLGIEFNKLFDITENFTTFEGAAEAAGSLNSILGGNMINTIDLMNAALDNPIEVFKLFKTSLDKTGKSFESMTPAMKRTIAEMMKMDVAEVERLARLDISQGISEMENMAASTAEMEEAARLATPTLEKLTKLGYKFAVAISPIVDLVGSIVDKIAQFVAEYPKVAKTIGGIVMGLGLLTAGLLALGKAIVFIKALGMSFGSTGGIVGALVGKAGATAGPAVVLTKIGAGATAGAKGFLALGAAALMLGAGIGLAAFGVSQFVSAFKGMAPDQIQQVTIALGVFTIGVTLMVFALSRMSLAAAKAGVAMLPLGAAIGLIGAGLGFAAWGASKLVQSFVQFMKEADLGKLANLYVGINGLAVAFSTLAASFMALAITSPNLLVFAASVRLALTDATLERLRQTAEYITAISTGLQNMNTVNLNQELAVNASKARAAFGRGGNVVVQIPGETINLELKGDIILDGNKIGEFVQEEIVKREDRQVPGGIQSSVGIRTGRYND